MDYTLPFLESCPEAGKRDKAEGGCGLLGLI
jgi:hypothetical protein